MTFFKEIKCADCGEITKLLFRTKLKDKNYICSKCAKKIPSYVKKTFKKDYTLEEYNDFKSYIEYSNTYLKPKFRETHEFHGISIDIRNKLFHLGYGINDKTLFFNLRNVAEFDLIFQAEEYREGIIGSKVKGNIVMWIVMKEPYLVHRETIAYGVKAKAKKALFSNTVNYENPKGMDFFIDAFATAWHDDLSEQNEESYTYEEVNVESTPSELQQAMSLFMIDNLDEITLSSLKLHRNRLMQTFHPDLGNSDDTKYAQKINTAYEVLKKTLSEAQ